MYMQSHPRHRQEPVSVNPLTPEIYLQCCLLNTKTLQSFYTAFTQPCADVQHFTVVKCFCNQHKSAVLSQRKETLQSRLSLRQNQLIGGDRVNSQRCSVGQRVWDFYVTGNNYDVKGLNSRLKISASSLLEYLAFWTPTKVSPVLHMTLSLTVLSIFCCSVTKTSLTN